MYKFIFQKIMNKKWLVSCMLIGTILLIAIACCNPMYKQAALQKMLTDELANYLETNNEYPVVTKVTGSLSDIRKNTYSTDLFNDYKTGAETLAGLYPHKAAAKNTHLRTHALTSGLEVKRSNVKNMDLSVDTLFDFEDYIEIVYGSLYDESIDEEGYLPAVISESMMINKGFILNDKIVTPIVDANGENIKVKICGVFKAKDASDPYWINDALSYSNNMFISDKVFDEVFMQEKMITTIISEFAVAFDYESIRTNEIDDFYAADKKISDDCQGGLYSCSFNFEDSFSNYTKGSNKVNITMWIFQIPVMILLFAFIFMVSNQIISIEQSEIAMLKSRGVSKFQLLLAYLMQGGIISAVALVFGLPLGYLFCQLFGSTRSFMEFSVRTTVTARITLTSVFYALGAAVLSMIVMTIPVMKYANFSIVEQKVNKKKNKAPLWQKLFLDFLLLIVAVYGYFNFKRQTDSIIENMDKEDALDPLLYFSSSVFILATALLLLRLLPHLSSLVFKIRKNKWKPAGFASFMQINKSIRKQSFIIVFLVFTLSLGIFNATTARTITGNEDMRVKYDNGSVITMKEKWRHNKAAVEMGYAEELEYYEPKTEYTDLFKKTDHAAKVVVDRKASFTVNVEMINDSTLFMAIDTYDFGKTAYMPKDATKYHWYYYLNSLAAQPDGVIISRNMANLYNVSIGDVVTVYRRNILNKMKFKNLTVCGIVDAWPGYENKQYTKQKDGTYAYMDRYLMVMNYNTCYSVYGLEPYEWWVNTDDPDAIYDFAEENNIAYETFTDSLAEADAIKEQPFYQITSGMLTIAFIVVLILSMIGFLIYWITSIKSRELMFGIYRAMGMSMGEIEKMLINEHIFGSLIPIIYGGIVGVLAALLYVPLIELTYISNYTTLETRIIISPADMIRIGVCVILMLLACFIVISRILKNMKITQALKLGED